VYFPFYSNSLSAILSPSRGGRVRLCAQAGGRLTELKMIPLKSEGIFEELLVFFGYDNI
jgi:hypothetical protein